MKTGTKKFSTCIRCVMEVHQCIDCYFTNECQDPDAEQEGKRIRREWYRSHHGLHVFEGVIIEDCLQCQQRAQIMVMATLEGRDPKEAEHNAAYCGEILNAKAEGGEPSAL